jgi:uncharacterized membrane protein YgcG
MATPQAAQVKAKNETIGELNLDLAKLRLIRWLVASVETEVTVDAAKYGTNLIQWMDSGYDVEAGVPLAITASGSVDLRPGFAGKANYTCTPKGINLNLGGGGFGGGGGGGFGGGGGGGGGGRGGRGGGGGRERW